MAVAIEPHQLTAFGSGTCAIGDKTRVGGRHRDDPFGHGGWIPDHDRTGGIERLRIERTLTNEEHLS